MLIGDRLRQVAERFGAHPCLQHRGTTLTYNEFANTSNLIARTLLADFPAARTIAVYLEELSSFILAIAALCTAGIRYVPVSREIYNSDRLSSVLKCANATVLIVDALPPTPPPPAVSIVNFEQLRDFPRTNSAHAHECRADAHAYVLHTSGTTGEPKGVIQSHRNVIRHIDAYGRSINIQPDDKVLQLASPASDAGVMDTFVALFHGAELIPINLPDIGFERTIGLIDERKISIVHSTPTVFRHLVGFSENGSFRSVRRVILGGEPAYIDDLRLFNEHFAADAVLVNGLGPTECTIALQAHFPHGTHVGGERLPVGAATDGVVATLCDDKGNLIEAPHQPGHLVLDSERLFVGYCTVSGESTRSGAYATGDLLQRRADGQLEFVSRSDSRIKVRGLWMDLANLETVLRSHADLVDVALTVDRLGQNTAVTAHCVPRRKSTLSEESIWLWLRSRCLPSQLPQRIALVDQLRTRSNGKVLRDMAIPHTEDLNSRSQTRETLEGIWKSLLGCDSVADSDNFFLIGGDSLSILNLAARMRKTLHVTIAPQILISRPTFRAHLDEVLRYATDTRD